MRPRGLRRRILGRRSVRFRIALACAGLFLVTGAAFVAATYALVDHSLGSGAPGTKNGVSASQTGVAQRLLFKTCPAAKAAGRLNSDPALRELCRKVFAGALRLGVADERTNDLHDLLLWSLVGLGVATVIAGVFGWAIGGRMLVPLQKVTAAAKRASQEHLDERITLSGPNDEIKQLADTFDDMLNRLDVAFASQRRFVANASHELRTPLTSMRTLIDVAMAKPTRSTDQLEELVTRVRGALGQSESLIDGLLTLARSDRGLTALEHADLEVAAQDAIDQVSAAAKDSGIVIAADLSPGPALGDRVLLERLAANLLDNAVRYNHPGGSVTVETGTDNEVSYLTVVNTGPHVPQPAVVSLFEPFTRLDDRVNNGHGVGLGLSIVSSVVKAHFGHLQADTLAQGGMRVSVRLPSSGNATYEMGDSDG